MTYWGEFRSHWPNLLGAALGVALGSALNHYMTNLFAPPLLAEFAWRKSDFALIGTLGLVTMVFVPVAGRFVDRFGARVAGSIGFAAVPLCFLAYSAMTGAIWQFFAITVVLHMFGVLTTTLVFSRVIVERFDRARGMGLSLLMTGPPLAGAVLVPVVGEFIQAEGWQSGYRLLAAISALGGLLAIALVGRHKTSHASSTRQKQPANIRAELAMLLRHPSFILIVGGMFFCNLPQAVVASQLVLMLMENSAPQDFATWVVSLYAIGVIVGRFICGIALDKVSPQLVAIVALGLPAIGFIALASPLDAPWILASAILVIGLAQGAEGDIGAYLTSRTFDMRHFSFVYSFLIASMGVATAVGSVALSITLSATGRFDLFMILAAAVTVVGALCFYATGRGRDVPAASAVQPV